ncbi:MAG: hypothetical protein ABR981_01055 [Candidatus Micrarchaeaceae archaeon]|jgi:hypothetical protein
MATTSQNKNTTTRYKTLARQESQANSAKVEARRKLWQQPRYQQTSISTATLQRTSIKKRMEHPRSQELFRSIVPAEQALRIQDFVDRAEKASTVAYIPQLPGGLTKFAFQSQAEIEYKNAIALAVKYGDRLFATKLKIKVAERFEKEKKLEVAFEWSKVSGDPETITRIGMKNINDYEQRAIFLQSKVFLNRAAMLVSKAVTVALEVGDEKLAKAIVLRAAKRYEEYGDSCENKGILSRIVGFELGHMRAIRWGTKCGNKDYTSKLTDKVIERYRNDNAVNLLSLVNAVLMMDALQVKIVRAILDNRKESYTTLVDAESD